MAKNPKIKDPTEVALSAIQDALSLNDPASDVRSDNLRDGGSRNDLRLDDETHDPRFGRSAANDDRATIGAMLQTIQKGRPRRSAYTIATLFAGLWLIGGGILTFLFLPALEAVIGNESAGLLALVGLGVLFLAPLILFYAMASIAWRGQELSLIAQSMAQMAVRFSEPENVASDAMVTVGQAIRREVAAMGDGVERAIARAGELEVLVSNEVSSLERAYSDNEQRIRGLLDDIAVQRDNLAGQAEQVRNVIASVQIDLRQDIALISDSIAARVDEVAQSITVALEERAEHITRAMGNAGDNMIVALGERGGDLLDRLEEASSQTAAAVLDASERLNASLNFKTGNVHEEFADLADKVHDMLNERLDTVTGAFETKSYSIIDNIAARTGELQDTITGAGDSLLSKIEAHAGDLTGKFENFGDQLAERILSSGEKASETLDVTVNTLVAKVVSQTETAHETLAGQIASFDGLVGKQGAELAERFARDSSTLGALITRHVSEFDRTLKTYGGEIVERMGQHTQGFGDNLKTYLDTFDENVETRIKALQQSFDARAVSMTDTIESRSASLEGTVTSRFMDMHSGLETRFTAVTSDIANCVNQLETRFGAVTMDIAGRVQQFETLLDGRVEAAASRVISSGQQASDVLTTRADELAQGIRARVEDADRSLRSLMTETAESVQNSTRAAQNSLLSLAGDVGTQLKGTASDIETRIQNASREAENMLIVTSTNASAQVKSSASEIERSIMVATENFGAAVGNSAEAVTDGVRQQAERLTQLIDDRRGSLIDQLGNKADDFSATVTVQSERLSNLIDDKRSKLVGAIGEKANEFATNIGSATEAALKSIESHGGAFTVAMMNNSSDLARQINIASEVAIGAVNKSLKDIEESSRAAIDQSRQVASTTVTELQETSKILRTDTLALFERLREGNILLQEVLTGAHDNLNSLERTLVTRVADFVTSMNDVTTRNGTSTSALEAQLNIFNTSTAGALENLSALASQLQGHGQALGDAARLVDQSNASTERSLADRNAMLEQLINTIDLRTLDMDERLHRFTQLLDESLQAAETRARDIAKVVAEAAGSASSAVGRQFEAVRMAVEDERRQTSEAMAEIYDQGTREADHMFRQSADKFASIVHSMKQMAGELHGELDATRAELRKGVLDMPQEAAESTAQMRKVIVDQIEALAELNRIVARHGNGLDVATTSRSRARDEEPMLVSAGARSESRSSARDHSASALPPPDFGPAPRRTEAPSVAPAGSDGWLSDMLHRGDAAPARAPASSNPLESLALDISRLVDRELAAEMWDRYQRGERKAFSKRLYTPNGQKAFDEVARKYRADRAFKGTVDRYINEFEKLLDDISRNDRGPAALRNQLTSETGLVYTLLAHAAGRLG